MTFSLPSTSCLRKLPIRETKLNICHHMLASSIQLQNRSFHVVERTRTSSKCQKMTNARAKRAKILIFHCQICKFAGFCCRRRRGCLSSLICIIKRQLFVLNFSLQFKFNALTDCAYYTRFPNSSKLLTLMAVTIITFLLKEIYSKY